jgi:hypothetical protein
MKKEIIIIIAFWMLCSSTVFGQYIILPKEGKSIKTDKIEYKSETTLFYFTQGSRNEILIDNISAIYDKDANEIDISPLVAKLKTQKTEKDQAEREALAAEQAKPKPVKQEPAKQEPVKQEVSQNEKPNTRTEQSVNAKKEDESDCVLDTKLGFQVACQDLPGEMTWEQAKNACPAGYRLPSIYELQDLCKNYSPNYRRGFGFVQIKVNKDKTVHQIEQHEYWSSSTDKKGRPLSVTTNDGEQEENKMSATHCVRCIKK